MKKNLPRFLAWLLLLCGLAGGPVAARLGRSIPPGVLRWSVTAGAALMIISFFWFPRRGENSVPERRLSANRKRKAAKVKPQRQPRGKAAEPKRRRPAAKQPLPDLPDPAGEAIGRRARKQSQAAAVKRGKR